MSSTLRYINILMVVSIALFFSIVAIDNIIDFDSNWQFVQHVLSMDTTFHRPVLMGRAINNLFLQKCAYYSIIIWEILTALLCWLGSLVLIAKIKHPTVEFNRAKKIAFIGLFMGFLLYMIGFIIIGSEWFSMWQSTTWNGQMKAGLFLNLILFVMLFIKDETSH